MQRRSSEARRLQIHHSMGAVALATLAALLFKEMQPATVMQKVLFATAIVAVIVVVNFLSNMFLSLTSEGSDAQQDPARRR